MSRKMLGNRSYQLNWLRPKWHSLQITTLSTYLSRNDIGEAGSFTIPRGSMYAHLPIPVIPSRNAEASPHWRPVYGHGHECFAANV